MARKNRKSRRASRSNPSASDGLLVAGAALGTAGLVLWWATRSSEAEAATPPSTLPTAPTPAPARIAILRDRFHLRSTPTIAAVGSVYPARTRVVLLGETSVRRGRSVLWAVRLLNGREGFAFVLPEEIQ